MTDPLDDLKSALQKATPAPDAAAKARAIALAQKNFRALQGSPSAPRPMSKPSLWTGAKTMLTTLTSHLTSRGGLTVTTAIAACGLMLATPFGQDILTPKSSQPAPISVEIMEDVVVPAPVPAPVPRPGQIAPQAMQGAPVAGTVAGTAEADVALMTDMAVGADGAFAPALAPASDTLARSAVTLGEPSITLQSTGSESFANAPQNPLRITQDNPVSTFSIDVDTASYALVRQSLNAGQLPPPDAVRIEELINYFPYDHPAPTGPHPFEPTVQVFETPWNPDTQLVHIGIQGARPDPSVRPPLNLVFLIDTSGSMNQPNKLPLLRQSFGLMLGALNPNDDVAIVTYAGSSTVALPPTPASDTATIRAALNALTAGGGTNGQGGLEQAYDLAEQMSEEGDVSRVILATDGDFNLGLSDPAGLESFIANKRDSGTYLNVLGFGRGSLSDTTMQTLAQNGNGTAAYIDTLSEAQKVLVDQITGALVPIANDVKLQVEFNPATVAEYRLIGFETRALNRTDFNNDRVDAGDLGAGHTVTALYEITPTGSPAQQSDPLRYSAEPAGDTPQTHSELGFLRLRYKSPGQTTSQLIETPFSETTQASTDAAFATAIAGFGQLLSHPSFLGEWSYDDAIALAQANTGTDPFGYRAQAIQLMRLAQSLSQ